MTERTKKIIQINLINHLKITKSYNIFEYIVAIFISYKKLSYGIYPKKINNSFMADLLFGIIYIYSPAMK